VRRTSSESSSFCVIKKQQCSITGKPTSIDGGITVRMRTAARRLFLIFLAEIKPWRPLAVIQSHYVVPDKVSTNLIASTLSRHAERRPCTSRQYPSLVLAAGTGNPSIAFNAGSVGPTRSISDSSCSNSMMTSERLSSFSFIDTYH
jgi:hypothetical protein